METHISDSFKIPIFGGNFSSMFKIAQFVGQSETWDRSFESKSGIDAFRRVHKERMLYDTLHIVVF
jgi:hypothetical protein